MLKYFRIALAALSVITEAEECLKDGKINFEEMDRLYKKIISNKNDLGLKNTDDDIIKQIIEAVTSIVNNSAK